MLTGAVTDTEAAYRLRAEAARLAAPHRLAGVSGTDLALLASAAIAPDAADSLLNAQSPLRHPTLIRSRRASKRRAQAPARAFQVFGGLPLANYRQNAVKTRSAQERSAWDRSDERNLNPVKRAYRHSTAPRFKPE